MFGFLKRLFGPVADFKALVENGALIIDVRTPQEFRQGHVKGSVNIPLDSINRETEKIGKKNLPVITVCQSGMRSGSAARILKNAGVEAYNGGGWLGFQHKIS